jgi:hypothetical protein
VNTRAIWAMPLANPLGYFQVCVGCLVVCVCLCACGSVCVWMGVLRAAAEWAPERVLCASQNRREENNWDPNRDFPYAQAGTSCMRTMTARAVNEIFREHAFQAAITFHGGMQAIAYEWGAPNHATAGSESPDERSQAQIASIMAAAAGVFQNQRYPHDRRVQMGEGHCAGARTRRDCVCARAG